MTQTVGDRNPLQTPGRSVRHVDEFSPACSCPSEYPMKEEAHGSALDTASQRNFDWVGFLCWADGEWVGGFQGSLLRHTVPAFTPQPVQGERVGERLSDRGRGASDGVRLNSAMCDALCKRAHNIRLRSSLRRAAVGPAHLLWITFTAGVFILAAFLMWEIGVSYAPKVSLLLICILLANCESLFCAGNTAGLVVGLCVVAVWCFIQERFVGAGVLCLALSLAIKPHDSGLIWLYFLLAGGIYRKRALQSLVITLVLALSAFLWLSHVAPHWLQDWQTNLATISAPGGINEPGLNSLTGRSAFVVIDLQAAISVFLDNPRIYNPASYLVCGALLLVWSICTLRSNFSRARAWFALAAVTAPTMLVTYHRPWDAKLLMLTVPACAIVVGRTRPDSLDSTAGDWRGVRVAWRSFPWRFSAIFQVGHLSTKGILEQMRTLLLMRPASLILLVMGIFYLWVYVQRTARDTDGCIVQTNSAQAAMKQD